MSDKSPEAADTKATLVSAEEFPPLVVKVADALKTASATFPRELDRIGFDEYCKLVGTGDVRTSYWPTLAQAAIAASEVERLREIESRAKVILEKRRVYAHEANWRTFDDVTFILEGDQHKGEL